MEYSKDQDVLGMFSHSAPIRIDRQNSTHPKTHQNLILLIYKILQQFLDAACTLHPALDDLLSAPAEEAKINEGQNSLDGNHVVREKPPGIGRHCPPALFPGRHLQYRHNHTASATHESVSERVMRQSSDSLGDVNHTLPLRRVLAKRVEGQEV